MASEVLKTWAMNRGLAMANHVFAKRGNHSEVHMGLEELSALMAFALTDGAEKALEMMTSELLAAAGERARER